MCMYGLGPVGLCVVTILASIGDRHLFETAFNRNFTDILQRL